MHNGGMNLCELCASYMLGECSAEEREAFARHLLTCPSCRQELRDLRRIWLALPMRMEETEAPADLKAEVLEAIFSQDGDFALDRPQDEPTGRSDNRATGVYAVPPERRKRPVWSYGLIAVLVPLLIASAVWNFALLKERNALRAGIPAQPARIVSFMPLKAVNQEFVSAKGMACILQQGNHKRLVVYLYGLTATEGSEAYQVWLLRGGQRSNAGTFRVGDNGFGVLIADMPDVTFDNIGITLEPDANGTEPRGSKVMGT